MHKKDTNPILPTTKKNKKMNKLFLSLGVVLAALFAISCSNDETECINTVSNESCTIEQEQQKGLAELKENIARLNQTWMLKAPATETRSPPRWRIVGKADMAGARIGKYAGVWGAVIVGAAASAFAIYITHPKSVATTVPAELYNGTTIIRLDESESPSQVDSIGYYHNKLLAEIGIENIIAADYDNIENIIIEGAEKLGMANGECTDISILKGNTDLQFIKNNMVQLNSTANAAEYCTLLRGNLKTISSAEMDVLQEYMSGLDAIDASQHPAYAQATVNIIGQSNLPQQTKEGLAGSVIVGNASSQLWRTVCQAD